jgi:flagellar biosynthetic protein FliQ
MQETDVAALIRAGLLVTLKLGGPPLLVGLLVGLVVSIIQAVTQLHEATLAFVPKVVVLCVTLVLLGPFMIRRSPPCGRTAGACSRPTSRT